MRYGLLASVLLGCCLVSCDYQRRINSDIEGEFVSFSEVFLDGRQSSFLTIRGTDGFVYTVEYSEKGKTRNTTRWVLQTQVDKLGDRTEEFKNILLPHDCMEIVSISFSPIGSNNVAYIAYKTYGGRIVVVVRRQGLLYNARREWIEIFPLYKVKEVLR